MPAGPSSVRGHRPDPVAVSLESLRAGTPITTNNQLCPYPGWLFLPLKRLLLSYRLD